MRRTSVVAFALCLSFALLSCPGVARAAGEEAAFEPAGTAAQDAPAEPGGSEGLPGADAAGQEQGDDDRDETGEAGQEADEDGDDPLPDEPDDIAEPTVPSRLVSYDAHVQNLGWQLSEGDRLSWFADRQTAGTEGRSLRLEALRIALDPALEGSISYQAHIQDAGWQRVRSDGELVGTSGRSLRLEALRVWLSGPVAEAYHVYYRAHVQNHGWLDWACDGQVAGSVGRSLRLEAIEIVLVAKGEAAPGDVRRPSACPVLTASAHVQNLGWQQARGIDVGQVQTVGTTGRSLRLEALRIARAAYAVAGSVSYNAHVQNLGWQRDLSRPGSWFADGSAAGTQGRSLSVEAVQLSLSGALGELYDLYYRAHVQDVGWLGWTKNGLTAGSIGRGKRLEALQLQLLPKGAAGPARQTEAFLGAAAVVASLPVGDGAARVQLSSALVGSTAYLFLPAFADTEALGVGQGAGGAGRVWVCGSPDGSYQETDASSTVGLDALGCAGDGGGGRLLYVKTNPAYSPVCAHVLRSAGVAGMFLTSDDPARTGRAYVDGSADHSARATGSMRLVAADGAVAYDGRLTQIKGRGNTTWKNSAKKPYQIKLAEKADLLGTGQKENRAKTWVLLANAFDPTLLANNIGYDLGRELGLADMECAPVDLWYDGEYRGSYLLCEKVQINGGRVGITDLEGQIEKANPGVALGSLPRAKGTNSYGKAFQYVRGITSPADVTGGYLLELDYHYYRQEACWFMSSAGPVVVKSPEYCSEVAMRYISEQFEGAWRKMERGSTEESVSAYLDLPSFADVMLVCGLEKVCDLLSSSMYFYKDRGSDVIYSGPVWDLDRGLGVNGTPTVTAYSNAKSPRLLATSAALRTAIKAQWATFSQATKDILLGDGAVRGSALMSFEAYVERVAASQSLNQVLWGLTWNESIYENNPLFTRYSDLATHTKGWISARLGWMDGVVSRY